MQVKNGIKGVVVAVTPDRVRIDTAFRDGVEIEWARGRPLRVGTYYHFENVEEKIAYERITLPSVYWDEATVLVRRLEFEEHELAVEWGYFGVMIDCFERRDPPSVQAAVWFTEYEEEGITIQSPEGFRGDLLKVVENTKNDGYVRDLALRIHDFLLVGDAFFIDPGRV